MALKHFTKVFAVDDAKVAKVTSDPSGGTTTYATQIDVPGIKEVVLAGTVNTKELRGDNQLLDSNSILASLQITVQHAKLDLDVLAMMLGASSVGDSGSSPNFKAQFDLLGTDRFNYWQLEAKTPSDGADFIGGDVHYVFWKCILSAYPDTGLAEEDYRIVSFTANVNPRLSDNKWIRILENETAASINIAGS